MTRMFFHLCLLVTFISLTSCSMFSSEDDAVSASEMEGEIADIEVESTDDLGGEDFQDLDVETADAENSGDAPVDQASDTPSDADSFSDIEDFNEGLIENELSGENMAANSVELDASEDWATDSGGGEELDLEVANLQPTDAPVYEDGSDSTDAAPVSVSGNKITNLEYKSQESGGTVVISASTPFEYQVREEPEFNQTIIEIADVQLPDQFKLPYIAKDFDQAVATVNAYQEPNSTTARFVIQYKDKLKPSIQLKNNTLHVMNSGLTATAIATTGSSESSPKYSGRKISLEMQDTDIKDVIYFIADEVGANIIVDDAVQGKANVKLKDVYWEEALASILKAHGLAYERQGQILRVAEVKTLTNEFKNESGKLEAQYAAKRLIEDRLVRVIPISYANLTVLAEQVKPFLSAAGGTAIIDQRSSSIIIHDYLGHVKRVEKLIKSLDIQPIQLLIEGKIIEASEQFSREFGIQWSNSGNSFDVGSQAATLTQTIRADRNPNSAPGGYIANLTVGTFDVLGDLTALLSIYEREQKIKILSSPKITTLNKEKAHIEATQQVPNIQVLATQGVGTQTNVTFQDAKLQLDVTPQVTFNSDVIMEVDVSRDVPGASVGDLGTRAINKRNAKTRVMVKDGNSLVLGGIFSQDETFTEGGVPLLKDIPVLGYLFKTKTKEISKNELVIFLTPRILNPENLMKATDLATASEVPASTSETNGSGKTDLDGEEWDSSSDELSNEVKSL
jgi:type IV pilus assembly protein PilQ